MIHNHITYANALDFILFLGFAFTTIRIVRSVRRRWPVE